MVLGLLTLTAIPSTIGICEGISEQKKANQRKDDERRMAKFYIDAFCEEGDSEDDAADIRGKRVVVRDNKVYLDSPDPSHRSIPSHTASAFYVPYPDDTREPTLGLVSTIPSDPPTLNWIYVDKHTLEVKYGNRTQSREHYVGPWDWAEDEVGVMMEGVEGFMAVEEEGGEEGGEGGGGWAVYFDRRGDGLKDLVGMGRRVVEIRLERRMVDEGDGEGGG
ncbi:hypothetical protein AJ80_01801 [Polytolypa hystricis UAMH7299]|uniref:Vacuolar protein sorting-associated protein 62 n=1 Tax=Polytolypa hystricis (strain UAMH7299) TaxID=1447883 RepID=A0A2B7Z0Y3_POLH7|nr:hypothetical protein AJ80_01801 [Polytolypa hystricis UAMH7299]